MTDAELVAAVLSEMRALYASLDFASACIGMDRKSSHGDLVTDLDTRAERILRDLLERLLPGSVTAGEEAGGGLGSELLWIVDPIDGTTNVVHGLPHAAATVALVRGGSVEVGIVYDIFGDAAYSAVAGAGAFRHGGPEPARLEVSATDALEDALVGFGLPYERSKAGQAFRVAERIFSRCQDLRRRGSAALDLVDVAQGRLDAHVEQDLRIWDVAAANLILSEAGGRLTTWSGQPLAWGATSDKIPVLATNAALHAACVELLAG